MSSRIARLPGLAAVALGVATLGCPRDRIPMPFEPDPLLDTVLVVLGRGEVSERFTGEVWVHGTTAYTSSWGRRGASLTPGNTLYVWDVSAATPRLVDSVLVDSNAVTVGDVEVTPDGRLLVVPTELAPGSIVIFDLSNPIQPQQVGRFTSTEITQGVHTCELAVVNGTPYAFLAVNRSSNQPSRLMIVDLSNPAQPRSVLSLAMGEPFIHDVFVRDGILFTALWDGGLTIWDIGGGGKGGSVSNPVVIGNVRTVDGNVHNVWWFHDPSSGSRRYAFVGEEGPAALGSSSSGDIHVVDVSNMAQPREVAVYSVPGAGTHNFFVDEARGILYAAYYNAGVQAIDVRGDLGVCPAAARRIDGRCDLVLAGRRIAAGILDQGIPVFIWGVHVSGSHLYASDMLNGLWKLTTLRR